jgi:anti-sigma factor RsiW
MAATEEMTCAELVELVTEYLDGALAEVERERFEAHLAACPHCDAYLDQIRATVAAAGRLTEDAVPQETLDGLLAAFRGWTTPAA